jgi:hypothetical protein
MNKVQEFITSGFRIYSQSDKISPSSDIDNYSDEYSVRNIPDSIFGNNSIGISHPLFTLLFSGKDSVRTMKTSPKKSIGIVNQYLNKDESIKGKVTISNIDWMMNKFASPKNVGDPKPVHIHTEDVPFDSNNVLFVPFINVKVASSSLWTNKTGEVSEKLGFAVKEEEIEQDWTYLNAYEGQLCWKNLEKGNNP